MNTKVIVYIVLTWLCLNVVVPLFVNSIDRLYKKRIDSLVQGSASLTRRLFFFLVRILLFVVLCTLQILFIILMLPTILWVPIAERFFPKIFEIEILGVKGYADQQRYVAKLVLKPEFWGVAFDQMRKRKDKNQTAV